MSKGRIQPAPYELNLDGKKVMVVHDLEEFSKEDIVRNGANLVISGHTHEPLVEKTDKLLVVNPGEICGWLHARHTAALVDTSALTATIEEIP